MKHAVFGALTALSTLLVVPAFAETKLVVAGSEAVDSLLDRMAVKFAETLEKNGGEAFEINNKIRHRVSQHGPYNRVTLIIDYLDKKCSSFVQLDKSLTVKNVTDTLDVERWRGNIDKIEQKHQCVDVMWCILFILLMYLTKGNPPNEHLLPQVSHVCLRVLSGSHPRGDRAQDAPYSWYKEAYQQGVQGGRAHAGYS